jgi:hypothetical protein
MNDAAAEIVRVLTGFGTLEPPGGLARPVFVNVRLAASTAEGKY